MRLVDDLVVDVKRNWRRTVYTSPIWRYALPQTLVVSMPVDKSFIGDAELLSRLGDVLRWIGPVSVTLTGPILDNSESQELAVALVRFARRSGSHTRLVVEEALSLNLCRRLVGVGLAEAVVPIGSLDESEHSKIVGSDLSCAFEAVSNLRESRIGSSMSLVVAATVSEDVNSSLSSLVGWARQSHVDSVVVVPKRGAHRQTQVDFGGVSVDKIAPSLRKKGQVTANSSNQMAIMLSADGDLWVSRDTALGAQDERDLPFLWKKSLGKRRAARESGIPFDEVDLDLWRG